MTARTPISVGVIICAAGKGSRTGFDKNKLLVSLRGEPVLKTTLSAFDFPAIQEIVVTSSEEDFAEISSICSAFERTSVQLGGETRFHSVYNALQNIKTDVVLIHDGARPFVSREIIESCIQSVKTYGSGICAIPCTDTVSFVKNDGIISTPNRSELRQIQTPQGFFTENILSAYQRAIESERTNFTDDASVFSAYCGIPHICEGARENYKLTYADDFSTNSFRCGFGIDTHAFGKEQDFITLGGVKIPSHSGLIAHSDGDVLVHAVMDALLSAVGLKDIGYYFPDTDAKWKNANSMKMLEQVLFLVKEQGYEVYNLSIAVQAEKPRLAKFIDDIKLSLSSVFKIDASRIGLTAGTNEGLGYVGEGKGITVNAYVLIKEENHYAS